MDCEKAPLKNNRESESSNSSDEKADSKENIRFLSPECRPLVTLGLILLMVISTASFILSVIVFTGSYTRKDFASCVPCSDLVVGPPNFPDKETDQVVVRKRLNGEEYCCAASTDQQSAFLRLVIKAALKREQADRTDDCDKDSPASDNCFLRSNYTTAAHLVLTAQASPEGGKPANGRRSTPIRGWTSERNPSFRVNIGLDRDRLLVKETGLYYVYSQLTMVEYRPSSPGSDSSGSASIVHHIERWNLVYPGQGVEKLLRHSESRLGTSGLPFTEYVSYVGGVIPLRVGDEVYVTASHPELVRSEEKSTYFGMYRI